MYRLARLTALLAAAVLALPVRAQGKPTYFEYQVEKPGAPSRMTESLTLAADGIRLLGAPSLVLTFSTRFSHQGENYWGPDSVAVQVESRAVLAARDRWPHAMDHTLSLVVGPAGSLNLSTAAYDTSVDANGPRELIESVMSRADAEKLFAANTIEVRVGSTRSDLNADQVVALHAFLRRSLAVPFAP